MPPPLIIREATPEDATNIAPLLDALGYPADVQTIVARLHELSTADPTGRVLVAVDDDQLVGFATLHSTPVLHRAAAVGRVTGIAVRPSVQGSGVGRELLRAAESYFRAQGLDRIEVTSGPTHTSAYQFYRRLGYVDQGVRFAKSLVDL